MGAHLDRNGHLMLVRLCPAMDLIFHSMRLNWNTSEDDEPTDGHLIG